MYLQIGSILLIMRIQDADNIIHQIAAFVCV